MTKNLGEEPLVHEGARVTNSTLGRYTEVGPGTILLNTTLGDYSYTTRFCDLANTRVGKFSNIASFSRIGPTDHPLDRASLHHFMYRTADYWPDAEDDADFFARRASRLTEIGHDTWIGHGAIIKPEVTVGHGAVVAAGSVVTKDVAPYTIVAGVPGHPFARTPASGHRRQAHRAGVVGLGSRAPAHRARRFPRAQGRGISREIRSRGGLNGVAECAN
jgi:phosphonate metabolism protein (transferase hexapeptide repeat family)